MNNNAIRTIVQKYRAKGIVKGVEFLLPPEKMACLVKELAQNGVLILGCDLWRYIDLGDSIGIIALVGAGLVIDEPLAAVNSVQANANLVLRFLTEQLPSDAELTSLILADPTVDALFIQ